MLCSKQREPPPHFAGCAFDLGEPLWGGRVAGRGQTNRRGGGAATTAQSRGCGGSAAAPATNDGAACRTTPQTNTPRSDHTTNNQHAQRPRSKRRRGGASPAPFCCPPPAGDRGRTFQQPRSDHTAGARAQDITGVMRTRRARQRLRSNFA